MRHPMCVPFICSRPGIHSVGPTVAYQEVYWSDLQVFIDSVCELLGLLFPVWWCTSICLSMQNNVLELKKQSSDNNKIAIFISSNNNISKIYLITVCQNKYHNRLYNMKQEKIFPFTFKLDFMFIKWWHSTANLIVDRDSLKLPMNSIGLGYRFEMKRFAFYTEDLLLWLL